MGIIGALKPIIITSQMFGCFLFKIKKQKNTYTLADSNSQYIYTVTLALFKLGIQTSILAYFISYMCGDDGVLEKFVSSVVTSGYLLIIISGVHTVIFSAKEMNAVLNQLNELQKFLFPHFKCKPLNFKKTAKIVTLLSLLRPVLMYLVHMYMCSFRMSTYMLYVVSTFVINAFINQIMCNVVSFSMGAIGIIYQGMNLVLWELKVRGINKNLRQLIVADNILKDSADYFNKVYGKFNLLTVFICFLEIMYGLSFKIVFHDETYSFMWMTSYTLQLLQLTFACHFSSYQVRE
jgi:hypothetical protein